MLSWDFHWKPGRSLSPTPSNTEGNSHLSSMVWVWLMSLLLIASLNSGRHLWGRRILWLSKVLLFSRVSLPRPSLTLTLFLESADEPWEGNGSQSSAHLDGFLLTTLVPPDLVTSVAFRCLCTIFCGCGYLFPPSCCNSNISLLWPACILTGSRIVTVCSNENSLVCFQRLPIWDQ